MQAQTTEPAGNGICVARGYGLKIYVQHGHLIVHDGIGRQRQIRRFHRTSKLRRLVIIGRSGFVTLDALRWLHNVRTASLHLDTSGELIAASIGKGPDFAALRRQQAVCASGPAGLEIARQVLRIKVEGQRALLDALPHGRAAIDPIEATLREIEDANTIEELLSAEARAADHYWQAWASLRLRLPLRELGRLPDHWLTFGQRASLLTSGPRTATNPANAILNYLYALLEAETIFACHAVGLDPGLGIFHTDRRDRASLALDLMEAVRPSVDAYLLALLTQRTLSAREFVETREGACRITPSFAADLASTCEVWRTHVAPVAERAAHLLIEYSGTRLPRLTPMTRGNWKRAWDERASDRRQHRSSSDFAKLPSTCRDCGRALPDRRHRYCEGCRAERWLRAGEDGRARAGEMLAQLRSDQLDPAHGGRAAEIRGRKNAAHQRAVRDWDGPSADPAVFRTEILPALRPLAITDLVAATGLSNHYCSLIRLGKRLPHPRHWEALRRLAP